MNRKYLGIALGMSLGVVMPLHAENLPNFNLIAKDGRFSPNKVEIPAGQKVNLIVNNDGPGPEEFESPGLKREKLIMPGKSANIIIGPLQAGVYEFYGEFHPQTARGQIVAK